MLRYAQWTAAWGAIALTCWIISAWLFSNVVFNEDAAILFRYAINFADTGTISYNPDGPPVEGATDFLFMVVIGVFVWLGADAYAASLALNFIALAGVLALLQRMFELRPTEVLALFVAHLILPSAFAAYVGFSIFVFEATLIACIAAAYWQRPWAFFCAVLVMCLTRPDGVVFGAGLCVWMMLRTKPRPWAPALCALVLPGVVYFLWRWWYFGHFLPLPFYVKSHAVRDTLGIFVGSSLFFALKSVVASMPALPLVLTHLPRLRGGMPFQLMVVASALVLPLLFYLSMRLDQNVSNRFFHFVPVVALLAAASLPLAAGHWARVFTFLVVGAAGFLTMPYEYRAMTMLNKTPAVALDIAKLEQPLRLGVSEAGHVALWSRANVTDLWGLNSPAYAGSPATASDIIAGEFDLLVLHRHAVYGCAVLATHMRQHRDGAGNQPEKDVRRLVDMVDDALSTLSSDSHAVYAVPFAASGVDRKDVFAVRLDAPHAAALEQILQRHGGQRCDIGMP